MERSHEQIRDAICDWLNESTPKDSYPYVKAVFAADFVYQYDGKLWRRTYAFDDAGTLNVGAAELVNETYEPVAAMSAETLDPTRVEFAGDTVRRFGRIFRGGSYPDKGIDYSDADVASLASNFQPVDNDLEHRETILSKKIGRLESVVARGAELFGTVSIPKWLHDEIGDAPIKCSIAIDKATKKIIGNALVLNPRVRDAELFAAFSASHQTRSVPPRKESLMNIWEKIKRAITGSAEFSDTERAEVERLSSVQFSQPVPNAEVEELKKRLAAKDRAALTAAAVAFAKEQVTNGKALSSDEAAISIVFTSLAERDNADGNGLAMFSDDGKVNERAGLTALKALFASRPTLKLAEEQIKAGNLVILSSEPASEGVSAAKIYADRAVAVAGATK